MKALIAMEPPSCLPDADAFIASTRTQVADGQNIAAVRAPYAYQGMVVNALPKLVRSRLASRADLRGRMSGVGSAKPGSQRTILRGRCGTAAASRPVSGKRWVQGPRSKVQGPRLCDSIEFPVTASPVRRVLHGHERHTPAWTECELTDDRRNMVVEASSLRRRADAPRNGEAQRRPSNGASKLRTPCSGYVRMPSSACPNAPVRSLSMMLLPFHHGMATS